MSKVFADTSALHSAISSTDSNHQRARASFAQLKAERAVLVTTSYVLVETYALLDRRFGKEASRRFREEFTPLLDVIWIDREVHEQAMDVFLVSPRSISLVDAASFICMRRLRLDRVWAIDRHFQEEGFEIVP